MTWDDAALATDARQLIENGVVNSIPDCLGIRAALPQRLIPANEQQYLLPKIIEAVLRETTKDLSSAHKRAARLCFGWTDLDYIALWWIAKRSSEIGLRERQPLDPLATSIEKISRARDKLLRRRTLRYMMADKQFVNGEGTASNFRARNREPTINELKNAISEVLYDAAAVERIANDCGLSPLGNDNPTPDEEPPSSPRTQRDRLTPENAPDYVPRDRYLQEFQNALASDVQFIAFVGEPGNGKSRLADELIQHIRQPSETRVNLRAHDLTTLNTDLSGALANIESHTTVDLAQEFAKLVSSEAAPTYCLVDNLDDDFTLVDRLFPPTTRSVVILTSRGKCLPEERGPSIFVDAMDTKEAAVLAKLIKPTLTDQDAYLLADTFGGRPLALDHVIKGLLAGERISPSAVCAGFKADAAAVMLRTKSKREVEATFTWIYETQLAQLHSIDSQAAWLLHLIAFLAPEGLPVALMQTALRAASPSEVEELEPIEFEAALRELRERHLVADRDGEISIHPFTQTIHRSILRDQAIEICRLLHEPIRQSNAQLPLDTGTERIGPVSILPHLLGIVRGFEKAQPNDLLDTDLGKTTELLIRSLSWVGQTNYLAELNPLMERLRDPEMYAVGRLTDWIDARLEWTRRLWEAGRMSSQVYMREAEEILTGGNRVLQGAQISLENHLTMISALADCGEYEFALTMLNEELASSPQLPPVDRALVECMKGEVCVTLGSWTEARESFNHSMALCLEGGERTDEEQAISARACKGLVDAFIYGTDWGLSPDDVARQAAFAKSEYLRDTIYELVARGAARNPLASAHMFHGLARLFGRSVMTIGLDYFLSDSAERQRFRRSDNCI